MPVYSFQKLEQLEDKRGLLPSKGSYVMRDRELKNCLRAWHHSLTAKMLSGSTAQGFASFHVYSLGWPGIGYHLVIEPQNVIQTPRGPRAKIVYANDVRLKTYHVGNSNDFAIGICVAGDYRTEKMDDATKATIDELQEALQKDGIGSADKSHHEFSGYGWKQCCVFNYQEMFKFLDGTPLQPAPDFYIIQQGDTLFGLANADERFTVEDLKRWNNIKDETKIQVGQKIWLKQPPTQDKPKTPVKPPTIKWVGHVKVDKLNVRKGAGTHFPQVGTLSKNAEISVYEEFKNGWLYIGNGQYVSNANGAYITKGKAAFKDAGKRVVAIAAVVNFYNGPRWTNPSGQFKKGEGWTIVDLIKTDGADQYKVKNSRGAIFYITARKDLVKIV